MRALKNRRYWPQAIATLLFALCALTSASAQSGPPLEDVLKGSQDDTVVVVAQRGNPDYRFGPTDKLRVTVYGEDDLSGEFQIDGTGYIRLPLIGPVRAAGYSAHQLESRIADQLNSGYLKDARVAVEVTAYRPFYILGQVNKPGEYPYVSNMSALNAIALAGGFTEKAVESTLFVRHEGETDEHAIAPDQLTQIMPGDVIRVRETAFWNFADIISPLTGLGYVATAAVAAP